MDMLAKPKDTKKSLKSYIDRIKELFLNRPLVTDIISKLIITFGVVLLIAGLYLMLSDPSLTQTPLSNSAVQSATAIISWVPGLPFNAGELTNSSVTTIGLVSWIVGIDLLLVGLGVWIRHRLARLVSLSIFILAAVFQFIEFITRGINGAPMSVLLLAVNAVIAYLIFATFDETKQKFENAGLICPPK